jgi:hypothetical protein
MATHDPKYTVQTRLANLTSRVTELEAENKRLRVHLAGELATKIDDAKRVIQDSIRVPQDGAPGRDGRDSTVPGPRGDVLFIGPAEVEAAVAAVRKELLTQRAKYLGAIEQALADSGGTSGAHQLIRARLQRVKRDAGL